MGPYIVIVFIKIKIIMEYDNYIIGAEIEKNISITRSK